MKKIKVLLADDHAILRDGLKIVLKSDKKFELAGEAVNGKEAVTLCSEINPGIVVMDVDMPVMNGIDAVKHIRKINKDVKILMLTMHENESYIFDAISSGVDGYIFKMADMEVFIEALNNLASGKKYFDPKVSEMLINEYQNKAVAADDNTERNVLPLTPREKEILAHIAKGYTTNDIAELLYISFFTASKHRKNIMKKLKVKNSAELIKYAYEHKLINL